MRLTDKQVGAIARRCRQLMRGGWLTHREWVVVDMMLFTGRDRGSDRLTISYTEICKLARVGRDVVAMALRKLAALKVFVVQRNWVRVPWMGASMAARVTASSYVFVAPCTESGGPLTDRGLNLSIFLSSFVQCEKRQKAAWQGAQEAPWAALQAAFLALVTTP